MYFRKVSNKLKLKNELSIIKLNEKLHENQHK